MGTTLATKFYLDRQRLATTQDLERVNRALSCEIASLRRAVDEERFDRKLDAMTTRMAVRLGVMFLVGTLVTIAFMPA
jgi:hypothetical protein